MATKAVEETNLPPGPSIVSSNSGDEETPQQQINTRTCRPSSGDLEEGPGPSNLLQLMTEKLQDSEAKSFEKQVFLEDTVKIILNELAWCEQEKSKKDQP